MADKIKNLFSKNLVTVRENETLAVADELMGKHNIRHLPVVDHEDVLVGILSRSDYMALKHLDFALDDVRVKSLMSTPVKTIASNTKVRAVAQLFIAQKISSGLVMEDDEIVGIITSKDLIRLLAEREEELEGLDMEALAAEGWISATSLR